MYTLKTKSGLSEQEFEFDNYQDLTEFLFRAIFYAKEKYEYVVTYRPEEGDE